jgi:hypothetical protein
MNLKKIKSFIYLDIDKMYSISSQIFEGMTEYILKSTSETVEEKTEQKGKIGSGQILADIVEKQKNEVEKKFLHDFSYNLFEDKLIENQKVLDITSMNVREQSQYLNDYRFVKITSRIAFNDTKLIEETLATFNELGLSITFLTKGGQMRPSDSELNKELNTIKDRNQKAKVKGLIESSFPKLKKIAAEDNMYLNEEFLERVRHMISYGYNGHFEVAAPFEVNESHILFSAILKRAMLKESELDIIKKHGRLSEKTFTIFGILTQTKDHKKDLQLYRDRNGDDSAAGSMKEAIMNIVFHLANIESTFSGKLSYEYVVDPIAIYQEI